ALFIVNDHVDIAMMAGADGVHLGPDDLSLESARKVAGEAMLIGASASTPAAAKAAVASGASYIGCGPAFATPLKPQKEVIGPDGVVAITKAARDAALRTGGTGESQLGPGTSRGDRRG